MSFDYPVTTHSSESLNIDYPSELNAEQLRAVTAPPGPILVIAGAGSGKTRTLTYRVAWLIEQGNAPENILLLTFTNKASREMLERVGNLLPHDISRLWGGTFHHIGNRLLRRHMDAIGLDRNFVIHDRDDSTALLKTCMEELGLTGKNKDKRFPKPDLILQIISLAVNTRQSMTQVIDKQFPQIAEYTPSILELENIYQRKKTETNAVDYDDLLTLPLEIFHSRPEILARYQEQFQHILVDEYQDTNAIQAELVDLLSAKHHQVTVVGDDAQSIYSWRGANFANIITFPDRHPGAEIIRLETNYRSVPEILRLANTAIEQNEVKFPKELRATRPNGLKPALVVLEDAHEQADFVARRALELIDEGISPSEIAVLYRAHFHSMELQMELTKRRIPFQITSGLRFFEQAHIKDVAAHLRFLVNPKDEVSFKRLAYLIPGVGPKSADKIWRQIHSGISWSDVKIPEKAREFWNQWSETRRQMNLDEPPAQLIRHIVDALYEDHLRTTYTNYLNRLEDLNQLQNFARNFSETSDFLAQLSLLTNVDAETDTDPAQTAESSIRLSSIHQAKGLEFKVVFLIMLCDGLFPSARSVETSEGEEEERRLFYVAATRAEDELYLTYPRIRTVGNNFSDYYQEPSRFLEDFPRDLCNTWKILNSTSPSRRWDS